VWPFLKGIGADNEKLEWRRCQRCHALYGDLTRPGTPRYGEAYVGTEDAQLRRG
jgi:hypothetical protein